MLTQLYLFNHLHLFHHRTDWSATPGDLLLLLPPFVPLGLRLHLPLPEEVADGGVLGGERAGQERHEAPEGLPQLLHVLLQRVDVRVQVRPAVLHLRQHVVHQVVHLPRARARKERQKRLNRVSRARRDAFTCLSHLAEIHK